MQNKTKIFFWSPFIDKVGTMNNVVNAASSLERYKKKNKFEISFINCFGEWNDLKYALLTQNIKTIDFYDIKHFLKFKKGGFLKSRLSYIFIFFISFIPLLKILKEKKPEYLNIYLITTLPLILFNFFKFDSKLILSIAGYPKLNFIRKFIWKKSANKIYRIICPSSELKDEIVKLKIFQEEKIFVIQDPHLNLKKIKQMKKDEYEIVNNEKKTIISIGRLTKQKNYSFLIRNFKTIINKNYNLQLIIIGDGEEKKELHKLIEDLNLIDSVKIIGRKNNIYNYLKQSDFYISTSEWEGSSLSMIDAAYSEIPILCSDCPAGRKEFIDINKRGFLYSNNSDKDFINKFNLMLNEDKKKIKLKLIEAKKETKKYTLFQFYTKFCKMLNL